MAAYDFEIKYCTSSTNPADGPSRRPDFKGGDNSPEHSFPSLEKKEWYKKLIEDDPEMVPNTPDQRITATVRKVNRVPASTTGTSSATGGVARRDRVKVAA